MRESEDFPVQSDEDREGFEWAENYDRETRLSIDTLTFAARADAERDYDRGLPMVEGVKRLVVAQLRLGTTLTLVEVEAYRDEYVKQRREAEREMVRLRVSIGEPATFWEPACR